MSWDQAQISKENAVEVGTAMWSVAVAMDCAAVKCNACRWALGGMSRMGC